MKPSLLIFMWIVVVPIGMSGGAFLINSITGTHFIKYDNNGTWLCYEPTANKSTNSCSMLMPFIPASYLKNLEEPKSKISFKSWTDVHLCDGGPGSISVTGRADPHLLIDCGEK